MNFSKIFEKRAFRSVSKGLFEKNERDIEI